MVAASMRPRQICRGIEWLFILTVLELCSFNEAPTDLPGNCLRASMRPRWRVRFNEAPTDLPGNWEGVARCAENIVGFNEAPTDLPGNYQAGASAP